MKNTDFRIGLSLGRVRGAGAAIGTGACGLLAAFVKCDILSGRHMGVCLFIF